MKTFPQLRPQKKRRDNQKSVAKQRRNQLTDSIPNLILNRNNSKLVNLGLYGKLKKQKVSTYRSRTTSTPVAIIYFIPSDVLKNCILSFLNSPLDRQSIQLTCRTFREMSDSPDILRSFSFCSDDRNAKFYNFETADGAIKCLYKFAKFGNLQALERYVTSGFLASIVLCAFLFSQSADTFCYQIVIQISISFITLHFYANPLGATIIQYLYLLGYFRSSNKSGLQQNKSIWNTQCETTTNTDNIYDEMAQIFQSMYHVRGIGHSSYCWNPLCNHSTPKYRKMPAILEASVQQLVYGLSNAYTRSMPSIRNMQNSIEFWNYFILKKFSQYCCIDCLQCCV